MLCGMPRVKRPISRGEKSIGKPLLRTIPIRRRSASLACRTVRSVRIARSIRLQILSSTAWQIIVLFVSVVSLERSEGAGVFLGWTILSRSLNFRSAIPSVRNLISSKNSQSATPSGPLIKSSRLRLLQRKLQLLPLHFASHQDRRQKLELSLTSRRIPLRRVILQLLNFSET